MRTAVSQSTDQPMIIDRQVRLAKNQELIWLGQQLCPEMPLYEVHYVYILGGEIDPIRLVSAVRDWVARTKLMRYVASDRDWSSVWIRETRDVECQFVDLGCSDDPFQASEQCVRDRIARRFNHTLSLFDATLMRLNDENWKLHLTLHHALTDAYSGRAILKSLADIYGTQCDEPSAPICDLYASYIDQQIQTCSGTVDERSAAWFAARDQPCVGSRFYSAKIAAPTARQTRVVVALNADENDAIAKTLLQAPFRQVTAPLSQFNLFATTLFAWLHRLSPCDDACIGVTAHGRSKPIYRDAVGLFMQLLPFRVQVAPDETFESLSRKVTAESMGFFANARPGSMTSRSQHAFDIALNVIDLSVDDFCSVPTSLQWMHTGYGDPNRRLTISVHPRGLNQWELLFDFSDQAFTELQRERAISHFRRTLMSIAASPGDSIADFEWLTDGDLKLIESHSGTLKEPGPENLWNRFQAACRLRPEGVAIRASGGEWTYRQLQQSAEALAAQFDSRQVGRIVPILCGRSANSVISMLAALCSGRCFMILESSLPTDRIQRLMAQSASHTVVDATGDLVALTDRDPSNDPADSIADGACYVLFTSGSTGQPNGVVVGHESLWNLLNAFESMSPLGTADRVAWWTNVGFDVAMYEVFSSLLFARTLCIPDDVQRLDADAMLEWMQRLSITSAYLPSFFLDATDRFLASGNSLSLKRLLVGVDPIPQRLLASIAGRIPEMELINGYGPTESTVCATLHRIDRNDRASGAASIGVPVPGNRIKIVDSNGRQVPPGVGGELWVSGIGLARGYLANPSLTEQRFAADARSGESTLWYRTGDRVRMRDDGSLEFLSRIDGQLKIGGVRIEPGEIRSVLRQCPGVDDCDILPISQSGRVERLIAVVESKSGIDVDQIRIQLREQLPAVMIPSRIVAMDTFPRTANGKPDRSRLEIEVQQRREAEQVLSFADTGSESGSQPRSSLEFTLLTLAQQVLGDQAFGVDTDFFAAGGSSLDAMKWVSLAKNLDIAITIQDVFRLRTVRSLTLATDLSNTENSPLLAPNVRADGVTKSIAPPAIGEPTMVFSEAQQTIAMNSILYPDSAAYHFQVRWEANGKINPLIAEACFAELSAIHPALRTTIGGDRAHPLAILHDRLPPDFRFVDRQLSESEIIADGKRKFELSDSSPLRVLLARKSDGCDVLAITVHHIAVDQQSVLLLVTQFAQLYRSAIGDRSGLIDVECCVSLKDRTLDSGSHLSRQPEQKQETFTWWVDRIAACERSGLLPEDFPSESKPTAVDDRGGFVSFSLDAQLSQSIRSAASRCSVSVGNYLLSVFAMLLSRYSKQQNFLIGLPVSRREDWNQPHPSIGNQIDVLPFACRLPDGVTCEQWIRQTQADFADFLANRHVSSLALTENLGELFRVMFVPQQPLQPVSLTDGLVLRPVISDLGVSKFDLTWFVSDASVQIDGAVEYRSGLFRRETIECMIDHFKAMLEQVVQNPNQTIRAIDFRTERDHLAAEALIGDQNRPAGDDDRQSVCQWIQSIAEQAANATAVRCGGASLTYQELMDRGRMLAWQLKRAGAGPEIPIACSAPRSVELIAGIIGILESGSAYVPMDPDAPPATIRQMVSQLKIPFAVGDHKTFGPQVELAIDRLIDLFGGTDSTSVVSQQWEDVDWHGEMLAYVLQTSGTTGERKGVEVTHRALLHSTLARIEHYQTSPARFLLLSPSWFDSSIAGIFWTLSTGGTLIIPQDDDLRDINKLCELIEHHQVTDVLLLPSLYQLLLSHGRHTQLQSLSRVIVAGESCPLSLVQRHHQMLPDTRLFNEYGPTEASVWTSVQELTTHEEQVSIGRCANGTPVLIVDEDLRPAPIGVPGEILIGGNRLARAYRCDAELTTQKFVKLHDGRQSQRYYRSGDLARLRPDGTMLFLGRSDDQMKINGVRVEPAEIEAAMQGIAGISDAAVVMVPRRKLPIAGSIDDLVELLHAMSDQDAERMLDQAIRQPSDSMVADAKEHFELSNGDVRVSIDLLRDRYIDTARQRQRTWLLNQSLRESIADLSALDRLAPTMVPGSDDHHVPRDLSNEQLTEQEIMEDWQTPLMQTMADWATQSKGDVLEIGFGRGVASTMIQNNAVRSHTIIEMNPHSIADHFHRWRSRFSERPIRLIAGRWQDVLDQLDRYDSVFFHAFPMNETEFVEFVATSATFAEHFFPVAAGLLRPGGVFTYLSTEIDSLSRRHQRSLFEHFSEIQMKVQPLAVPSDTKDAWWTNQMVVVRAIR